MGKRASLAAEEEAVQAAAEAGVLASAIAEALTGGVQRCRELSNVHRLTDCRNVGGVEVYAC